MKYPESKRFVVLAQPIASEPFYCVGSFDTDAEANQHIGEQKLKKFKPYVIDKNDYPGEAAQKESEAQVKSDSNN